MQGYNYAKIKQIVKKDFKDPCNWVTDTYYWIHLNNIRLSG